MCIGLPFCIFHGSDGVINQVHPVQKDPVYQREGMV